MDPSSRPENCESCRRRTYAVDDVDEMAIPLLFPLEPCGSDRIITKRLNTIVEVAGFNSSDTVLDFGTQHGVRLPADTVEEWLDPLWQLIFVPSSPSLGLQCRQPAEWRGDCGYQKLQRLPPGCVSRDRCRRCAGTCRTIWRISSRGLAASCIREARSSFRVRRKASSINCVGRLPVSGSTTMFAPLPISTAV